MRLGRRSLLFSRVRCASSLPRIFCSNDKLARAMTQILEFLLLIPAAILFVLCSIFAVECAAALLPTAREDLSTAPRPSVGILVPAHNEERDICVTLETLLAQTQPQDRIVVIADNCTDDTADVARSFEGVTVIERENKELRGKGYAMDFGLNFLASDPPEVVMAVDSDCSVAEGSVEILTRTAAARQCPAQAAYLMEAGEESTPIDALSTLALIIKNEVRPTGLKRLGLPCVLMGSGMAFPWSVIQQASLANSRTVDDMQLTLDLSALGYAPVYCPEARVNGRLMEGDAAKSQRSRWEHGHLEIVLQQVPRLFSEAWRQRRFDLLTLALDLSIPPMSLLAIAWVAFFGLVLALAWAGVPVGAIVGLLAISGFLIGAASLGAWSRFASDSVSLIDLLKAPIYILWKVPIYIAFLIKPKTQWVSTERD